MTYIIKASAALIAVAGFLYLAETIQAQHKQNTVDTSAVYNLDEIIISASRFEESPQSVGRNVTVISRRELERAVVTNVADILAGQQSLHIIGSRQTPGSLQQGFLRGAGSNHFVVMIDGIRISDPSTNNNGVDLSELSLVGVERIEIVRGSHSTLYGSSAVGGVVNIITRKAGSPGLNMSLNTQQGVVSGSAFSTSNKLGLNLTSDSGLYANIGAFLQHTGGIDATTDTIADPNAFAPQDRDGFDKLDLTGKLGYETSDLDVYASFRSSDQVSEVDGGAFLDDDNARIEFSRNLFSYGASYSFSDGWSLKFSGAYSDLNRNFVNDSSLVDYAGNYDGTYTETNGEGTLWQNELTTAFEEESFRLLIGAGSSIQTMNSRAHVYASAFDFESTTDLDTLNLKETINSAFVHADLNGSLLSDQLDAFSLVLGGRLARHNQFGTHFVYEINPRVQLAASSLIYGALTTGFNAPSLYQLHAPEQGFGAHTNRGNESLEPEESVSYELGWKQTIGSRIRLEVALFKTHMRNVIEYVYLWDEATTIPNLGFADYRGDTYINISRQDMTGIELGLNVHAMPGLTLGGNLTYTQSSLSLAPEDIDGEYIGSNHVQVFESGVFVNERREVEGLTRRPSMSANIHVSYQPSGALALNLSSRFVGARDDVFYSENLGPFGALDRSKISGYNLTDISARYRLNNRISFVLQVENVFDTQYLELNGYRTRGRGVFLMAALSI